MLVNVLGSWVFKIFATISAVNALMAVGAAFWCIWDGVPDYSGRLLVLAGFSIIQAIFCVFLSWLFKTF